MRCLLPVLLLLAACDSTTLGTAVPSFDYRTAQAEVAVGVTALPDGRQLVWADVEGSPRPADGTNSYPAILIVERNGLGQPHVYRSEGYGHASGGVLRPDGTPVLLTSQTGEFLNSATYGARGLRLVAFENEGPRVLYRNETAIYAPNDGVRLAPDGGFYLLEYSSIVHLSPTGAVVWRRTLAQLTPDASQAHPAHLEVGADGSVYVLLTTYDGPRSTLVALDPSGHVRATSTFAQAGRILHKTTLRTNATGAIAYLLLEADASAATREAIRLGLTGLTATVTPNLLIAPGQISRAFAEPDGALVVAHTMPRGSSFGPVDVFVERYASLGAGRLNLPTLLGRFGERGKVNEVGGLALLPDGRLAVAGGVGPEFYLPEGGTNFDLRVSYYSPTRAVALDE